MIVDEQVLMNLEHKMWRESQTADIEGRHELADRLRHYAKEIVEILKEGNKRNETKRDVYG